MNYKINNSCNNKNNYENDCHSVSALPLFRQGRNLLGFMFYSITFTVFLLNRQYE